MHLGHQNRLFPFLPLHVTQYVLMRKSVEEKSQKGMKPAPSDIEQLYGSWAL